MRTFKDITGKRFELLVVVERVLHGARYIWSCTCDCGKVVNVRTEALLSGQRKSCGCLRSTGCLIGNKYGILTVLSYAGRTKSGIIVNCSCDCGNTKTKQVRDLTRMSFAHCGCRKTTLPAMYKPELPQLIRRVFEDYKTNAARRGKSFALTLHAFTKMITSSCHYCGMPPSKIKTLRGAILMWNGIDRMNNSEGYSEENSVSCCSDCNYLKCERNYDEFITKINDIYQIRVKNSLTV